MPDQDNQQQPTQSTNLAADSDRDDLISNLNEPLESSPDLNNKCVPNQALANSQLDAANAEDADPEG
jgi:hypothetical protein